MAIRVYNVTREGLLAKDYGLWDQIRRAAVSIPSNLAEGYERESDIEFRRFVFIAKGSCSELRTQIYIAEALNYLEANDDESLADECKEKSSMLSGLATNLRSHINKDRMNKHNSNPRHTT